MGNGEPSSSEKADFAEEVGLDKTHTKEASQHHDMLGTYLEPAGEEEER